MQGSAFVLDAPTLLVVVVLNAIFSGALMLLAKEPRRDGGAVGLWGMAMLLGALGLVIQAGGQGTPWIAGLGTTVLLGATATSWMASRAFAERPPIPGLALAGPVAWLLLLPLQTASGWWVALAAWIGGVHVLASSWELWHLRREGLPSTRAAVLLMLSHGVVYIARGADAAMGRDAGAWADAIQNALLIEGLLNTVGMAVVLLCLMKERIELRTSEQLRALALLDSLTGIANRRHFDERLQAELRRARRSRLPVSLLMVDVDNFKLFNDAFGHPEGDSCLRAIAGTMTSLVRRPADMVARYGGEEFAVLLPGTALAGATEVAETVRMAVLSLGLPHNTRSGVVTISVGVAAMQPDRDGDHAAVLVQAADRALYQAKLDGRNCVRTAAEVALAA